MAKSSRGDELFSKSSRADELFPTTPSYFMPGKMAYHSHLSLSLFVRVWKPISSRNTFPSPIPHCYRPPLLTPALVELDLALVGGRGRGNIQHWGGKCANIVCFPVESKGERDVRIYHVNTQFSHPMPPPPSFSFCPGVIYDTTVQSPLAGNTHTHCIDLHNGYSWNYGYQNPNPNPPWNNGCGRQ